ncbi:MAG: hypothetical protein ACYCPW_12185 [Nitrososphaerales archaeon]
MKENAFFDPNAALREERRRTVDRAQNFDEIFELVKRVVEEELGVHRAGLSLVLANMSSEVGAYHPMGANVIVVNKALISGLQRVTKNPQQVNAFIFMVLLHEYLHSLGYVDENEVRKLAQTICGNSLGKDHPSVKLANANWLAMYPQLESLSQPNSNELEVIRKFDSSSTSYIG